LLRDVEAIVMAQATELGWRQPYGNRLARLKRHRFHLVEAGRYTGGLDVESKLKPDRGLLTYLHASGRSEMHKWLEQHRRSIGRRPSVDLRRRFLDRTRPIPVPPDTDAEPGREPSLGAQRGSG
jgi:NTE family protein